MAYTRADCRKDLKKRVAEKQSLLDIAQWAYAVYLEHKEDIDADPKFKSILFELNFIDVHPEGEYSYERLDEMVDHLINEDA